MKAVIIRLQKLRFALLAVSGFLFCVATMTNFIDPDFYWHLKFGQDFWRGPFPYLDTATWTHFGKIWINHEWGGGILFAFLYNHFGYYALSLLIGSITWAAFLIIHRAYKKPITEMSLLVSLACLWSAQHIVVMRLAMFTIFFTALLIYTLERAHEKKWYWWWPIIFWAWSVLHGSWILGFIIIAIYFGSAVLAHGVNRFTHYHMDPFYSISTLKKFIIPVILSLAAILINPYGYHVYTEVLTYFTHSFYKNNIGEWLPSYVYPIYWLAWIPALLGLSLLLRGRLKHTISWPQFFLFLAFTFSAIQYKRNVLPLVLIAAPLIATTLEDCPAKHTRKIGSSKDSFSVSIITSTYTTIGIFLVCVLFVSRISLSTDHWPPPALVRASLMPVEAMAFLKDHTKGERVYIFGKVTWGGYITQEIPSALIYLDGRGPVTWMLDFQETVFEHSFKILNQPGGLAELESSPAQYIVLQNPADPILRRPDRINRFIFASSFNTIINPPPLELEKDLAISAHWKKIYTDYRANIWERLRN